MKSGMAFRSQFVLVLVAGLCMVMLLLQVPTPAQSIFASIVGTVTDASAAVVPNAKVTATNVNTNEKREFQTNQFGNYEINNLFPGVYSVEVEAPGFGKQRKDGIKLSSQDITREDFALAVSAEVTQVTVFAEAAARIETDSGKLSNVRTLRQIQTLPLIGGVSPRGIWRLLIITPGMSQDGTISGSRANQTDMTLDGVSLTAGGAGSSLDFIESVEEIKVDFGNNSAEFKALGTMTVSSKRGTNELHGALYDNYVTGAFRASNYFTGQKSGVPTHFFGTSAGGPVYLPKLYDGRNRTFWFLSYEAPFGPQSVNTFTPTVPLTSWKNGNFSGETTVIKDPLNDGLPFTNNIIPPGRISNVAKQYLNFWPAPNFGDSTVFTSSNYRAQKLGPFYKQHNGSVRVDHQISRANTIFARYHHHRNHAPYWESNLPGTLGQEDILRKIRSAIVSDTHIFSPTLINEFRFGLAFDSIPWYNNMVNGPAFIKAAGLLNVTRDGTIPNVRQIPVISFSQGAGIQG
ncbi:MAG TPA: carboxypeptidase-like regulatory domain-containing protein, partial [Pyrinomonadaceae bacterium]|nr:carboxypeptidase-like regulatory domain-containing protein [Pyrinomonadaceae bacterium]